VYFLLRTKQPVERTKSLIPVDSTIIYGIEISDPDNVVEMQKVGDKWQIVKPIRWDANNYNVSRLFREIIQIQVPRTIMADGNDAIKRYGLTADKAMQLKLYDKNKTILAHLYFGNLNNPNDYFRYEGSKDIFQIKEKVTNSFPPELSRWRSPSVLSFQEQDIKRIEVEHPKAKYVLTAGKSSWLYKDAKEDFAISNDNRAMMRTVSILSRLETQGFIDNPSQAQLLAYEQPLSTVRIFMKDGTMRKLIFAQITSNDIYVMVDDKINVLYGVSGDTLERFTRYALVFQQSYM
jgi:hypothetical protein